MENNENNQENEIKKEKNKNAKKEQKTTIVLLIIVLILVLALGIGGGFLLSKKVLFNKNETQNSVNNNVNKTENEDNNTVNKTEKEMYESVINEYKKVMEGFDLNTFEYEGNSIANIQEVIMIYRYPENKSQIGYTYYDVDKNGTKEMITGLYDKSRNIFILSSIYGYNTNTKTAEKIYQLDTLERGSVAIYDNGIIHSAGSAGATVHIAEFGRIGSNGYSYEQLEWVEEEYEEGKSIPTYKDLKTKRILDYKSWDEMTTKYLNNSNEVKFENIEVIEAKMKDKQTTLTEDAKITKEIIASGWAGSSMHRVRLYSNGDAYYITFNGKGETEDCIIGKEIVAKNVDEISVKKGEHGEFLGVIVKGKNMNIVKEDTTDWIFFGEESNTSTVNNEYNTAIVELKKCLKDESWLEANVYITDSESANDDAVADDQKIDFIVCRGDRLPIVIVEAKSENVRYRKVVLVAYVNGSVKSEIINRGHYYHGGSVVDANKNVVSSAFMHMGDESTTLYRITDGNVYFLGMYGKNDVSENGKQFTNYYIQDKEEYEKNKDMSKVVSKEDYDKFKASLDEAQYRFVNIGTELNNSNVDLYVK